MHVWCPPLARDSSGVATASPFIPRWEHLTPPICAPSIGCSIAFPPPRRLLVQWVPHGFGYRSLNVGFCLWLWQRARRGDRVEIMVHEPYLAFGEGGDAVDGGRLRSSPDDDRSWRARRRRVWIAIPALGAAMASLRARPGRAVRMAARSEQPAEPAPMTIRRVRDRYALDGGPIVGHLGSYGTVATRASICDRAAHPARRAERRLVLLGQQRRAIPQQLVRAHPQLAARIHATGTLVSAGLGGSTSRRATC